VIPNHHLGLPSAPLVLNLRVKSVSQVHLQTIELMTDATLIMVLMQLLSTGLAPLNLGFQFVDSSQDPQVEVSSIEIFTGLLLQVL
jgi:hypothetical protein